MNSRLHTHLHSKKICFGEIHHQTLSPANLAWGSLDNNEQGATKILDSQVASIG